MTLAFGVPSAAHAVVFKAPKNFNVGSVPVSVAIGNFNDDTDPDLVVANEGSNNVSILLGGPGVNFTGPTNFGVGNGPSSVAVGNFNGDTRADLAVTNQGDNNVSVLLGSGAGSFEPSGSFAVGSGPRSVAVGNFNGDGNSDLAVANFDSDSVTVLGGNGTGGFTPISPCCSSTVFSGDGPTSLVVGDFYPGGYSDLAVANFNGDDVTTLDSYCFLSEFCTRNTVPVGDGPRSIEAENITGGATPDLVVANYNADDLSFVTYGNCGEICPNQFRIPAGDGPSSVTCGQFFGSPGPGVDCVVSNEIARTVRGLDGCTGTSCTGGTTQNTGINPFSIACGDFDLNGLDDCATANSGSNDTSVEEQAGCEGESATNTNATATDGGDTLTGTTGNDVIVGLGGNDTISGLGGADKLCGDAGNDTLVGGNGADILTGRAGTDTANFSTRTTAVTVDIDNVADDGNGSDGPAGARDNVRTDVENLIGGSAGDTLTGTVNSSTSNILDGRDGADTFNGLGGSDTASYSTRTTGVTVDIDNVADDGDSSDGPAGTRDNVKSDVENLIGGSGGDTLTGNRLTNASNALDGRAGADILSGLGGTDTASYSTRTTGVTVDIDDVADDGNGLDGPAGARDNVETDIENLIGGSAGDTLTGTVNLSIGNTLDGGAGPDILSGLGGTDTASYSTRDTPVTVNIDNVANDGDASDGSVTRDNVKTDVENLIGGLGPDTLTGSAANNSLTGGLGADFLLGLNGNDILFANDGVADSSLNCDGGGTSGTADTAHVDGLDPPPSGCETVGP